MKRLLASASLFLAATVLVGTTVFMACTYAARRVALTHATPVTVAARPRPRARRRTRTSVEPLVLPAMPRVARASLPATELARLIRRCAPDVAPATYAALATVESSADVWALRDNDANIVYRPTTRAAAVAYAHALIVHERARYGKRDAGIDVGIGQVNSRNFRSLGVTASDMLDPCTNVRVSAGMLASAYRRQDAAVDDALPAREREQLVLRRAFEVYNSGKPTGDDRYALAVVGAAESDAAAELGAAGMSPLHAVGVPAVEVRPFGPVDPFRRAAAPFALAMSGGERQASRTR